MSFKQCSSVALVVTGFGLIAVPSAMRGQEWPRDELPPLIDEDREVAIAVSAAPERVSADASVLVLRRGVGFVQVREGTNGFTCLVDRYWAQALEPVCFNREAAESIMPPLLRRNELRERGLSLDEIDREIEAGFERGEFRLPEKLAIGYMFSSAQDIYSDSGKHHGNWVPHIMIFVPYLGGEEVGGGVFRAGQRDAAFFAIVPGFIDPVFEN